MDYSLNEKTINIIIIVLLVSILIMSYINYTHITLKKCDNLHHSNDKQNETKYGSDKSTPHINNIDKSNYDKNKLVLYFSPRCGHCINFKQTWNDIKQTINVSSKLETICEDYDCTSPDSKCPADVPGYPSLYLIKKDGTKLLYNGVRTKDSIIDFVETNKSN
jgi:hypothetical protein